jgi:hypothetical protein
LSSVEIAIYNDNQSFYEEKRGVLMVLNINVPHIQLMSVIA